MRLAVAAVAAIGGLGSAVTVADAAPRARITAGPSAETTETSARFEFETTELAPLTSFECRLDGAAWKGCSSPAAYDGLTGGPHEFSVRLVGPLADSTPDSRRWLVAQRTELLPPPPPPPAPPPPPGTPPPPPGTTTPPPPPTRPQHPARRLDAHGCAYGANRVGEVRDRLLVTALTCLVNRQRHIRGLRRVRTSPRLTAAAERMARDMVARRYFAHVSLTGETVVDRVRRTGYLGDARGWTLGEVLAWGTGRRSSPAATVRAWMRSREHRAVLLAPMFRDAGMGIAHGLPVAGIRHGATIAGEFGRLG
jgi:uncharacterized protein YkwD